MNHDGFHGSPSILPVGDSGLLIRFSSQLTDQANLAAVRAASALSRAELWGIREIVPSLVSVFVKYDPATIDFETLAGEMRLRLSTLAEQAEPETRHVRMNVSFGGDCGPDLEQASEACGLGPADFVAAHNRSALRVLAVGFAPGFIYCGMHPEELHIPRKADVRPNVPPGSVLFAAGQTAITSTWVPTGWYVIGHTEFRNFLPGESVVTPVRAGDRLDIQGAVDARERRV